MNSTNFNIITLQPYEHMRRVYCIYGYFCVFIFMATVLIMRKIHFVLLFLSFVSLVYSLMYMYPMKNSLIKSCKQVWDELQFKDVDAGALKKVFDICGKENIALNGRTHHSNNYNILDTFNCSRPLRNLNVPRPYVVLASFPGSGNTWTRFLIETVTGIKTGSVYYDHVFAGSKFCPARGKVFIVKTHREDNSLATHSDCVKIGIKRLNFSSAIYIIRNPYNALLSEFNRQHKQKRKTGNRTSVNKMGIAPKGSFNTIEWSSFVKASTNQWKSLTLTWMQRKDIPVYVLVYERLRENVVREILNLTKFLNYKMRFETVHCLSSEIVSGYKREKPAWVTKENVYNNSLREIVNSAIEYVNKNIDRKWNVSNILKSYVLPKANPNS